MADLKAIYRSIYFLCLMPILCGYDPGYVDIKKELKKSKCAIFGQVVSTNLIGKKYVYWEAVATIDVKLARGECANLKETTIPIIYTATPSEMFPLDNDLIVGRYVLLLLNHFTCNPDVRLITDPRYGDLDYIFYCDGNGYDINEQKSQILCGFSYSEREPTVLSREDIVGE